jgi:hypothetical protein
MRNFRTVIAMSGALLLAQFLNSSAFADEFHFSNLLVGERPSGLGGAYTALSDDHTGMVYNPAGIAFADAGREVASINLFSGTTVEYDKVFGDQGWTRSSAELVPGFFGGLIEMSDTSMMGYVLSVRDSVNEEQDQRFEDVPASGSLQTDLNAGATYDEVRINSDISYRWYDAGASYAAKLSDGWSWGVSLFAHYRKYGATLNQRVLEQDGSAGDNSTENGGYESIYSSRKWTEYGVRPTFGVRWKGKMNSVGATIAKTQLLSRTYRYQFSQDRASPSGGTFFSYDTLRESSVKQKFPVIVKLGAAIQVSDHFKLVGDLSWFSEANHAATPGNDVPPDVLDTKSFTNLAAAFEYSSDSAYSYRGAIFTDNANVNVSEAKQFERREEIDGVGVSFSVTRTGEDGEYWNVGATLSHGNGKATLGDFGFDQTAGAVVDASRSVYSIYLGHSF